MRTAELKVLASLVAGVAVVALVAMVGITQMEGPLSLEEVQTQMLKTDHYHPPNPLEDPELREPYDVDISKEPATSKADFDKANKLVDDAAKIMEAVIKKLTTQDEERDALMDDAIEQSDKLHQIRHLLINVKAETNGIRTHEDTRYVFANPFGKVNDPPQQSLAPFKKQVGDLKTKTDKLRTDCKALVTKAYDQRNKAILLDSELYHEVHAAKIMLKDAVQIIHRHNDRVEMFNHKDFDIIHRVDVKLNNDFRINRHKLRGMFNLAKSMSGRQPNEASEVTHLLTDLLIVNGETQERIERMDGIISSIEMDRDYRTPKPTAAP